MRLTQLLLLFLSLLLPICTIARDWQKGDACPETIKTGVPGYGRVSDEKDEPFTFGTMASVHTALSSCPDITGLDLRVAVLGCTGWPDRWNFPFKLEGGDIYPPLKELRLDGYNFEQRQFDEASFDRESNWLPFYQKVLDWVSSGNAVRHLQSLNIDPVQRNKTNLDLWLDAMDWTQIESLALLSGSASVVMVPRLESLQRLELSIKNVTATLHFISGLQNDTLTHLTIRQKWLPPLSTILTRQGHSLQNLELRTEEVLESVTPAYNVSELDMLTHMAPNLKHLSINVHRNGTWPIEVFDTIASISSLETLDLWLDITSKCRRQKEERYDIGVDVDEWDLINGKCEGEDQYQRPFVNETTSLHIFKHLQNNRIEKPLKQVTFWVGDWSGPGDGGYYIPDWLHGKVAKVVCKSEGKEEGEGWCIVERGNEYWKGYYY